MWRIFVIDGKRIPWAVGTHDLVTGLDIPPNDGLGYMTTAEMREEMAKHEEPKKFPWQREAVAIGVGID